MNTEYRNKFYNRIKDVFEKEETQEQQAFLQAREGFDYCQKSAFDLAKQAYTMYADEPDRAKQAFLDIMKLADISPTEMKLIEDALDVKAAPSSKSKTDQLREDYPR